MTTTIKELKDMAGHLGLVMGYLNYGPSDFINGAPPANPAPAFKALAKFRAWASANTMRRNEVDEAIWAMERGLQALADARDGDLGGLMYLYPARDACEMFQGDIEKQLKAMKREARP